MSKFFKPVKYPELDKLRENLNTPAFTTIDMSSPIEADITEVLKMVNREITNLTTGTSALRKGGLHFEKGTCPALTSLKSLERDPTNRALLHRFIRCSRQDFGERVTLYFIELFKDADSNLETVLWTS